MLYKVFKFVFLINEDAHPRRMWVQSLTMVFLPFELKFQLYKLLKTRVQLTIVLLPQLGKTQISIKGLVKIFMNQG